MLKKFLNENISKIIDLQVGFDSFNGTLSLRNGFYYIYTGNEFIQLKLQNVSSYGYLEGDFTHPYVVVTH